MSGQPIQLRLGTIAQWVAANTLLIDGEFGIEVNPDTSTRRIKLGDGVLRWNQLPYFNFELDESLIAAALVDHDGEVSAHSTAFPAITGQELLAGTNVDARRISAANLKTAAETFGVAKTDVIYTSAATLTPESGKHYVCANDIELFTPIDIEANVLWRSTFFLEPGTGVTYPELWGAIGSANPITSNLMEVIVANGSAPYIRWLGGTYGGADPETPIPDSVIFVTTSGNDSNSGHSWGQAKATVQAGINTAFAEMRTQVWVSAGTYDAGSINGFVILPGLTVYGGFVGSESSLSERISTPPQDDYGAATYTNETILTSRTNITPTALCCVSGSPSDRGIPRISGCTITLSKRGVYSSYWLGLTVTDCNIEYNANANTSVASFGCGAYRCQLQYCTISNNALSHTGSKGGGAYECYLSNCRVVYNAARDGAGIHTCTAVSCLIDSNITLSAGVGGGAHTSTCTDCTISNNTSLAGGGGVSAVSCSDCVFIANIGSANQACTESGTFFNSIFIGHSNSGIGYGDFYNCIFAANHGTYGVFVPGVTLRNCMLLHNTSDLIVDGGSLTTYNSVFWKNTWANPPSGSHTNVCTDTTLSLASFIAPLDIVVGRPATFAALLAAIMAHGYDTASAGPQIDAGNNTYAAMTTDIMGRPRIYNTTVDIGPYEYQA
jgi:hypothetical protein